MEWGQIIMKFYYGKDHDTWKRGCIPLGQFKSEEDGSHEFDLGVWLNPHDNSPSFAIVYGYKDHQYMSGDFETYVKLSHRGTISDFHLETIIRYDKYLKENKSEKTNS